MRSFLRRKESPSSRSGTQRRTAQCFAMNNSDHHRCRRPRGRLGVHHAQKKASKGQPGDERHAPVSLRHGQRRWGRGQGFERPYSPGIGRRSCSTDPISASRVIPASLRTGGRRGIRPRLIFVAAQFRFRSSFSWRCSGITEDSVPSAEISVRWWVDEKIDRVAEDG